MGFLQEAAALRRSAEKARQQMEISLNEEIRACFEQIAIDFEREAAAIEQAAIRPDDGDIKI